MKNKLNITVDEALLAQAKRYAAKHKVSLSQMIEHYFRTLVRPARKKNILDVLRELPKPALKVEGDLKEKYYDQQKEKYGF